jgi:hypothetical protein
MFLRQQRFVHHRINVAVRWHPPVVIVSRRNLTVTQPSCTTKSRLALVQHSPNLRGFLVTPTCNDTASNVRATLVTTRRSLNSWQGHGTDLLGDSLAHVGSDRGDPLPKIVLTAHGTTGFDVANVVKNMDPTDEDLAKSGGLVHYTGSIMAFPTACFLWTVRRPEDVTLESLAPILLHQPAMEYLLVGTQVMVPPHQMLKLKERLKREIGEGLVVEQMDVVRLHCVCFLKFGK